MRLLRPSSKRLSAPALALSLAALAFGCGASAQHTHAGDDLSGSKQPQQDVLMFVSARYSDTSADMSPPWLDDHDPTPSADFFYTRNRERFRMLAEYLWTDDEHDLERLQVGWQITEATRLWLGRFHQSTSFWNTEHHHGQFLQTSIYRPAIEEFEDTGSILPSHTTGLLLEHRYDLRNDAGIQFSFSAGLTGTLVNADLPQIEPFDLLDPESGHGDSVSLRVGFSPDSLGDDQVGFSLGRHSVNIATDIALPAQWQPGIDGVDLTTVGLYGDWTKGRWRLLGAVNRLDAKPRGGFGGPANKTIVSYVQSEYKFRDKWTAYGRIEHTAGDMGYVELFPLFLREQALVGIKTYLKRNHALTVEIGSADTQAEHFHRLSLQWSAVFP
jgi:hypothetical protein